MSDNHRSLTRRAWLRTAGAAGAVGLAGCTSGDSGGGSGGSGGSNGDSGGSNGGSAGSAGNGDWPDLSGKEIHFITDESSDTAKQFWNRVAKDFREATGAKTRMEFTGLGSNSVQRITQLIQSGSPPDIFTMNTSNASRFRSADILAPATDAVESISGRLGEPEAQATVKLDGEHWFVPLWLNVNSYYYRQDQADVVPDTWDKALEYAQQVHESDSELAGTYVPAGSGSHVCYRIMAWMFSNGGNLCKWDGDKIEIAYDGGTNRKKLVEVLDYLKQRQQYSPSAADSSWTSWINAIPNSVAASSGYHGFRPIVQSVQRERPFAKDVNLVPGYPKPPGGSHTTVASADGLGTFKGSDTEAANTFMRFTLQEKYLTDIYMDLTPVHNIPAWKRYRDSDAYNDAIKSLSGWPADAIKTYQEETTFKTRPYDTDPPNPYAGAAYNSPPLWNLQIDVLVNDVSPEAAIDKYAPKHQKLIDEAQSD